MTLQSRAGASLNYSAKNELIVLLASFIISMSCIWFYNLTKVDSENFALGDENHHAHETYNGAQYTATSIDEAAKVLKQPVNCTRDQASVIWLGNSQLHTINQFKHGQHLAPHWLRMATSDPSCFTPFALSLPNANLQEYFILTNYSLSVTKPKAVILSLVFDDLREDGIRADSRTLLDHTLREQLSVSNVGRDIIHRFDNEFAKGEIGKDENSGLDSFFQKDIESFLTEKLAAVFNIWADRPNIRARLLTDLYFLRNNVFGIKSTTVRKQIQSRYDRNMASLEAILNDLHDRKIDAILYIAPIRSDIELPYDKDEYANWKAQVEILAKRHSATFANFENLVPGEYWGTYHEDDVDFMHFQEEGHRLLSSAVYVELAKVLKGM